MMVCCMLDGSDASVMQHTVMLIHMYRLAAFKLNSTKSRHAYWLKNKTSDAAIQSPGQKFDSEVLTPNHFQGNERKRDICDHH